MWWHNILWYNEVSIPFILQLDTITSGSDLLTANLFSLKRGNYQLILTVNYGRPSGGDVEGRGGDFKSPPHLLHHLPRRTPWVPGRLRHRDRHPRGQVAPAACSHEVGGPLRDLPGPD